jgi:2',3'-cyclic-nucleotide 2'-phosphodiesterase (5'-nucleotidase family)
MSSFPSDHPTSIHQAETIPGQPQRIIILHTNDIHGRTEGIARVATIVDRLRAEHSDIPVLYFDLGDVEESTVALSSLTKGAAMHRLLSAVGCDAAAIGNAALLSYGPAVLADEAAFARYPLLMANLCQGDGSPVPGTEPRYMLQAGNLPLGLIGITTDMPELGDIYESLLKLRILPLAEAVRELCAALRQDGAGAMILLSHMGLATDRQLASELQGKVVLILGLIGGQPVAPERLYRVVATGWELDTAGGYSQADWHLSVTCDFPTIVREALESYLQTHRPVGGVEMGRVDGPIISS